MCCATESPFDYRPISEHSDNSRSHVIHDQIQEFDLYLVVLDRSALFDTSFAERPDLDRYVKRLPDRSLSLPKSDSSGYVVPAQICYTEPTASRKPEISRT